ncbi:MAG TPA: glycine--tRNA ligase subunit beta [Acetobacteraceae bacterium]|nr:glycine--tRNA ligase subunit beta [Acetobacteraceae bacterium]
MPELLLELFSEEIPARMQTRAAVDLARLLTEALAPISPDGLQTFAGPRRLALVATVQAAQPESSITERGPRTSAPEAALAGFLRKHGATRDQLTAEGDYWVLTKSSPAVDAATLIAQAMPPLLRRFPWPKSMRWGWGGDFTWVRPLRRILCLLDGRVVPFELGEHGLRSGDETEGHRFHAPGPFVVSSFPEWEEGIRARFVIPGAPERRLLIKEGIARLAASAQLQVVPDDGLLDEVAGLVEWPVPLLGRIDAAFMDLPPEVMQVSMRVNQRYFALRNPDGSAAPRFAFVANIEARDGGAAIIAGNERVLRARFSDARHFWDLDRRTRLADRVPALDGVTFHAKLGTQGQRVRRLVRLARHIAPLVGADPARAERAALLAKADLVTGMVGEFPELQGVMGFYYAAHDGEAPEVAEAVRDHYAPKGPSDPVPTAPVSIAVALADKIDLLAGFFAIGEIPTGSGDPFALRRAALGVIRIIRENRLRLNLLKLFHEAEVDLPAAVPTQALLEFIADRLRVQLRAEGERHDVLAAVFAAGADDDLVRLLARTEAVAQFLATPDGANLLTGSRRAANIVRIEDKKDGPHRGEVDPDLLREPEEQALDAALAHTEAELGGLLAAEKFVPAMGLLAQLRPTLDAFFDQVTVNAPDKALRENRLRLLARVGAAMDRAADFSQIEG